ncbi:MAG: hypothetical protein RL223_3800, partial [Pseudomonadota bacterium]
MRGGDGMTIDPAQRRAWYGTDEPVAAAHTLQLGPWALACEGGALQAVHWQGVELLRGLAWLLRDEDWGTPTPRCGPLQVQARDAQRLVWQQTLDWGPEAGPGRVCGPDGAPAPVGSSVPTHAPVYAPVYALVDTMVDPAQGAPGLHAVVHGEALIDAAGGGRLTLRVASCARGVLRSARSGLVLLHPATLAGTPLAVEHADGRIEATCFPLTISPGQPVFDIRALDWSPGPGWQAQVRLTADLPGRPDAAFEMEDQRNWSDASYKTYVGSLLDPWPYALPAGQVLVQQAVLRVWPTGLPVGDVAGAAAATAEPSASAPAPALGPVPAAPVAESCPSGASVPPASPPCLPALGIGFPHLARGPDADEVAAVIALRPRWLQVEADLGRHADGDGDADADADADPDADPAAGRPWPLAAQLQSAATLARACGARVQIDAIADDAQSPDDAADRLARACAQAGLAPQAVRLLPRSLLLSWQPRDTWPAVPPPPRWSAALRAAFPAAAIGGGVYTNFTELNRLDPPAAGLDFIGHGSCPIVHAADDRSVLLTLQTWSAMAATVRARWPGLPWQVGPLTLAAARNPYGRAPAPNPQHRRLPLAIRDPRHDADFGAAWLAATVVTLAP